MDDIDAGGGFYGFRGEVLASISDISVLEIVTKAYGKPHAYRKVMKVCVVTLFIVCFWKITSDYL